MSDQLAALLSAADESLPEGELARKLTLGRPLRVKFGVDPSRPDLHLGHAVPLRTLRRFQDLGHVAVLIIGDVTGMVGDPSGRSETRPMLTADEMAVNAHSYLDQAGRVLDMDTVEVRRNSEWLAAMSVYDMLALASSATVAQMLEREDFQVRFGENRPISIVELLYPLLQARDSVAVQADVELGGSDQKFNLLMGRELQRDAGQEPQAIVTFPLLVGTDGSKKMSKSYDNYVGLTDEPGQMFGRLMRIPDGLIGTYLRLCTDATESEADLVIQGLEDGSLKPNDEKRRMAAAVVDLYHGGGTGAAAEARFDEVHREHQIPSDVEEVEIPSAAVKDGQVWVPGLLKGLGLAASNSEARRLITQGGVRVDGEPLAVEDLSENVLRGAVVQVGRRQFRRLR